MSKNKIERNLQLIAQQVEVEPDEPFHRYNLAGEYMRLKDYHKALQELIKSRQLCTKLKNVGFGFYLLKKQVSCLIQLSKFEEAYFTCSEAIEIYPNSPDLYFLLGRISLQLQDERSAINSFSKAISIKTVPKGYSSDPSIQKEKAPFFLATVYEQRKKRKKALLLYEKVLMENPANLQCFERFINLHSDEEVLAEKLVKIADNDKRLETFMIHLFETNFCEAALTIYNFLSAEQKGKHQLLKQILALLNYNELSLIKDKRLKLIYKVIVSNKIQLRSSEDCFVHFLLSGYWPDHVKPTPLDYQILDFSYKLSKRQQREDLAQMLIRLWKYFVEIEEDKKIRAERKWALAHCLLEESAYLANSRKKNERLIKELNANG